VTKKLQIVTVISELFLFGWGRVVEKISVQCVVNSRDISEHIFSDLIFCSLCLSF
jgi:hypothetical protein